MRPEELKQTLIDMQRETEAGKLNWRLDMQTTEGNEEKYTVEEEGEVWTVDECYASYRCNYRGKDFCMITYEMIKVSGEKVRTVNYVFLPPKGIGLFSLHTLLKHSIDVNAALITQVHALWECLMELVKKQSSQVAFHITEADVNIEDDFL